MSSTLSRLLSRSYRVLLLFALLGGGIYLNSLDNPFQYDDDVIVVHNMNIQEAGNIPRFFVEPQLGATDPKLSNHYRPLVVTSYAIDYAIGGLNPVGYHVVNLAFHVGTAFLVFLIMKAMLGGGSEVRSQKSETRNQKSENSPFDKGGLRGIFNCPSGGDSSLAILCEKW